MNCPECRSIQIECKNRVIRRVRRGDGAQTRCVVVHWQCQRCGNRFVQEIAAAVQPIRFVEV
jgi:hypothetical protein